MTAAQALRTLVERRLDDDTALSPEVGLLVLAALDGTLASVLTGNSTPPTAEEAFADEGGVRGAFLTSLAVTGFRGIGPTVRLNFSPGPGLTLVVGRNGSGKSSLAEALELLLTGGSTRWQGRNAEWQEGWRNLHHQGDALIEAVVAIEGTTALTTITRQWNQAANGLEDHQAFQQATGQPRASHDVLGWERALVSYRPFLSHNELGSIFDQGPSARFDALSDLLGLELLTTARSSLRDTRLARERAVKEANQLLPPALLAALSASDDERAALCIEALNAPTRDLDTVELLLANAVQADDGPLDTLRRLLTIELPAAEAVREVCGSLRVAAAEIDRVADRAQDRLRRAASVLERAITFHDDEGDQPCPVCGERVLDAAWRVEAERELAKVRAATHEAEAADLAGSASLRSAIELRPSVPSALHEAAGVGIDAEAVRACWDEWTRAPEPDAPHAARLRSCADQLETAYNPLAVALQEMKSAATKELERREDAWRPLAAQLRDWLPVARTALSGSEQIPHLRSGESWLTSAEEGLRAERFRPIAEKATEIWETLRQSSNVSLEQLTLTGSANRRRLELAVNVDGVAGVALSVMSQGELNALALSLFLPRALMPESPFRFVVIDDPVQAMDPSKVDGLAQVLAEVARERQVIVLTHDDRLPEAIRRLQLDATIVEVTRRPGSVVETREALNPVQRCIDDARALISTRELPDEVVERVVPTFCRLALEAACIEIVRRRRIGRGESYESVEPMLDDAHSLVEKLGLLLFDEPGRGGQATAAVNQRWQSWAGDTVVMANRGSHDGLPRARLDDLVHNTARLAPLLNEAQ